MSIRAIVRKCITHYGSEPNNLFNQMGTSYTFGEEEEDAIYLDCITKIGVKQDDAHYLLAGSKCEFVVIQQDEDPSTEWDQIDMTGCKTYKTSGRVYYFTVTDDSHNTEIVKFREMLVTEKEDIETLQGELLKLHLKEISIGYSYHSFV